MINTTNNNFSTTTGIRAGTTKSNFFRKNTMYNLPWKNQTPVEKIKTIKLSHARKDVVQLIYNHKIEQEQSYLVSNINKSNFSDKLNLRMIVTPSTKSTTINKFYSNLKVN
jgi:hypothetical protein